MADWQEGFVMMDDAAEGDISKLVKLWNRNVPVWTKGRVEYQNIADEQASTRGLRRKGDRYEIAWEIRELRDKTLTKSAWCNGTMWLQLGKNKYCYHGVPREVFSKLTRTYTPMKFYILMIKGKYK
jgi:hypothetical protein